MARIDRQVVNENLAIASGGSVSSSYLNKAERGVANLAVKIPSGFEGVLFVEASDDASNWYFFRDATGTRVYVDPSTPTTTEWWAVSADVYPALHVRFKSCTDSSGTAGQAQAAARPLPIMGIT